MKTKLKTFSPIIAALIIVFLLSNCGDGVSSSNEYMGKLPGLAKKYQEEITDLEKRIKESTDLQKAYNLDQKKDKLEDEAEKVIEEYLAGNPITHLPFEQEADYQFEINEISVEGASESRIFYKAKVTITEDILNNWGNPPGFAKNFFAYFIAVDKEGNSLTRKPGVMMNLSRSPFKTNMEAEMNGSLDGPGDLVTFAKLVFVSKEKYDNPNK